ncbi:stage II sporulation protein P [Alkalihalobacillus sp. LMS39]|uniref:stage II sporulation protein P n=1 Tax=Alkalihalobacillus sp. LMS39 TaxID=2924032 RepID=UPI001FB1B705|nr:stage II sporulation protein P [Alkalihalobacillus sp. LMS39]UOE92111.1 stage II sporulation protein P [Alkalihalobacillus sp. LMS39]
MKNKPSYTFTFTTVRNTILSFIIGMVFIFIITGFIATNAYSSSMNNVSSNISGELLTYVLAFENSYFGQALPEQFEPPSTLTLGFELATNIKPDDIRTLIGNEIPGLSTFNTRIIVAGEGTDITNMPIESPPALEVLMEEREASMIDLEELEKLKPKETVQEKGNQQVFIHHTHSWESFLPHLPGVKNPDRATHNEMNITLVGERLGEELEASGIPTIVDKTDMTSKLHSRNMKSVQSYRLSREIVEEAITENDDIMFIFDLHRDSLRKDKTTVTINGEKYARILFVIGQSHENYELNEKFAKELHSKLEKKYPGLSRGVFGKDKTTGNGVYNQDLADSSILIEFGGVDNSLEENYRATAAFAEVFSEVYWEQQQD